MSHTVPWTGFCVRPLRDGVAVPPTRRPPAPPWGGPRCRSTGTGGEQCGRVVHGAGGAVFAVSLGREWSRCYLLRWYRLVGRQVRNPLRLQVVTPFGLGLSVSKERCSCRGREDGPR